LPHFYSYFEVFLFGTVVVQHGHTKTKVAISPAQLPLLCSFVVLETPPIGLEAKTGGDITRKTPFSPFWLVAIHIPLIPSFLRVKVSIIYDGSLLHRESHFNSRQIKKSGQFLLFWRPLRIKVTIWHLNN